MRITGTDLEYNNISLDNKVIFIEDGHKYIHVDKPDLKFTSVTTLLHHYAEQFDAKAQATKCCNNPASKYYGMDPIVVADTWFNYGSECADKGTDLHAYGEGLFNGTPNLVAPDNPKAVWAEQAVKDILAAGYKLATTEMLVYDTDLKIAGQSDLILKKQRRNSPEFDFMVYDWKFLSKPLAKKSFYSRVHGYKKMLGPFKQLMDCNWIHYSIQLAIYQTLTGDPGRVTEKVLIVVEDDKYSLIPAYPMRVFWDSNNELQCVHEMYNGRWWDSRMNAHYAHKPTDIIGI